MAYWNPFGWDEETRRSIQSVVRPVMQVASMAASLGAFSGGGGAKAGTGTEGGAMDPTTGTGTLDEALTGQSGIHEWTTDMPLDAPKTFTPDQSLITPDGSMEFNPKPLTNVSFSGVEQLPEINVPYNMTPGAANDANQGFGENFGVPNSQVMGDEWTKAANQALPSSETGTLNASTKLDVQQYQPTDGNKVLTGETSMTELDAQRDAMRQPQTGVKPPTTETPATKPSNTPEAKPTEPPKDKTEGPGPGGKEISSWADVLDKGFNWENIEKFLKSPEGRKWLLMDEKGLAGIGRKLTAAADAGVGGTVGLTPEERKKILKRLKKEREERKKERRNR